VPLRPPSPTWCRRNRLASYIPPTSARSAVRCRSVRRRAPDQMLSRHKFGSAARSDAENDGLTPADGPRLGRDRICRWLASASFRPLRRTHPAQRPTPHVEKRALPGGLHLRCGCVCHPVTSASRALWARPPVSVGMDWGIWWKTASRAMPYTVPQTAAERRST